MSFMHIEPQLFFAHALRLPTLNTIVMVKFELVYFVELLTEKAMEQQLLRA